MNTTAAVLPQPPFSVLDLFSGAGGASYGFHAHPAFRLIGAVDRQIGKPSSGLGTLECNSTYKANIGITPLNADIRALSHGELTSYLRETSRETKVDVLISCAPCTGFSRTIRKNLVDDDPRNSLVARSADFVESLLPSIFIMENVGELIEGRFNFYYHALRDRLENAGYAVRGSVHSLNQFGLPQRRRRSLVIAARQPLKLHTLEELWSGYYVKSEAATVRRAISHLPRISAGETDAVDLMHSSPNFSSHALRRLELIPHDGGSWPDLLNKPDGEKYLIPTMRRYVDQGRVGPHPDIYGRMAWDKPAPTLKRECSHAGNGRYCHPEQDRHCTVREMACIQGFPESYVFVAESLSNMYRHVGDAVPPLISYQIAQVSHWSLTGVKPDIASAVLPGTSLRPQDILRATHQQLELDQLKTAARATGIG